VGQVLELYAAVMRLSPGHETATCNRFHTRHEMCRWPDDDEEEDKVRARVLVGLEGSLGVGRGWGVVDMPERRDRWARLSDVGGPCCQPSLLPHEP
jgi:hypothetical protein